jgi:hypothetical protein
VPARTKLHRAGRGESSGGPPGRTPWAGQRGREPASRCRYLRSDEGAPAGQAPPSRPWLRPSPGRRVVPCHERCLSTPDLGETGASYRGSATPPGQPDHQHRDDAAHLATTSSALMAGSAPRALDLTQRSAQQLKLGLPSYLFRQRIGVGFACRQRRRPGSAITARYLKRPFPRRPRQRPGHRPCDGLRTSYNSRPTELRGGSVIGWNQGPSSATARRPPAAPACHPR